MKWVGITGGIASGKTLVCDYLSKKGFFVLDADAIAHRLMKRGGPCHQRIFNKFGPTFFDENQELVRKKLGSYVFSNKEKLRELEEIVHPEVQRETREQKEELLKKDVQLVFHNIPLLYEKKLEKEYDWIVVVNCSKRQQIERMSGRSPKLSADDIINMLKAQIPLEEKLKRANFVLDNTKDKSHLFVQVEALLSKKIG